MMKKNVRKSVVVMAAMVTGVVALGVGYQESQAAAKFAFDAAAARPSVNSDDGADAVEASASPVPATAQVKAKARGPKIVKADSPRLIERVAMIRAVSDISDEQSGLMPTAARDSRLRILAREEKTETPASDEGLVKQTRVEAMKLLAAATREHLEFTVRRGIPGTIVFEHADKSGN